MRPARTFFQGKTDGLSESNTHGSQDLLADVGLCASICVVVDLCLQAVNIGVHHFQTGTFQSVEVCIAAVLGSIQAKLAGFLSGLGQDVLLLSSVSFWNTCSETEMVVGPMMWLETLTYLHTSCMEADMMDSGMFSTADTRPVSSAV